MIHPAGLLLILLLQPPAQFPSVGSQPPQCEVAADAAYAYTMEQPVQVGGSPMYGAARQKRYLDALRGPAGERVQYKRTGANRAPDGTIVDGYVVTYEGLATPVTIYLDWYHYNPQKAPRGFTCGQPFNLGVPPLDPFHDGSAQQKVAIEQGAVREFEPIPLATGSTTHGVIYDRFRLLAIGSRRATAAGSRMDASKLPAELAQQRIIVAAYPQTCGDRTVAPAAIDIVGPNGAPLPKPPALQVHGAEIEPLLPGIRPPAGTLFIAVPLSTPRPNDTVRITYAEACGASSDQVSLRLAMTGPRVITMPEPVLPEGAPVGQPVLLQVVVDPEGAMKEALYVGGPAALAKAAIEAVATWKAEPARINGAPIAASALVEVRFKKP